MSDKKNDTIEYVKLGVVIVGGILGYILLDRDLTAIKEDLGAIQKESDLISLQLKKTPMIGVNVTPSTDALYQDFVDPGLHYDMQKFHVRCEVTNYGEIPVSIDALTLKIKRNSLEDSIMSRLAIPAPPAPVDDDAPHVESRTVSEQDQNDSQNGVFVSLQSGKELAWDGDTIEVTHDIDYTLSPTETRYVLFDFAVLLPVDPSWLVIDGVVAGVAEVSTEPDEGESTEANPESEKHNRGSRTISLSTMGTTIVTMNGFELPAMYAPEAAAYEPRTVSPAPQSAPFPMSAK